MKRLSSAMLCALFLFACGPSHTTPTSRDPIGGVDDDQKPSDEVKLSYAVDIAPLMKDVGCMDCHGRKWAKSYETLITKVVPGNPMASVLYTRILQDMPPIEEGYLPLTAEQQKLIFDWITQGAVE